jgi:hypothetical protein
LSPLSRFAAAVLLAVVLFQVAGVSLAAGLPCPVECQDDGPGGQCPPTCQDCFCCAHTRATFGEAVGVIAPCLVGLVTCLASESQPPQGETREILRVPKRAL